MLDADARDRVIIALDCDRDRALELGHALAGKASWIKIGMTLYYAEGPAIVEEFKSLGFKVFLDLKFYDIPHQVEGAARSAALAGADLLSVHGSGASAMLRACREGAEQAATVRGDRPRLVAITVLTSMDQDCLTEIGVDHPVAEQADRLARLAQASGIDGVVCSPREAAHMRELLGPDALVVTPGVRPAGADLGDQSRVATPSDAISAGASHIVVGRPITAVSDPLAAYEAIVSELVEKVG
ncbi:MAG: orotidine-5'-phosphate decarboxylase [Collinsella sp.]|nr:orotidine-5'-phosphate decarboxylase [Collinsella sp.]